FEAVLTPAVFVLSGIEVVLAVAVSVAVSEAIMRVRPVKALFNIAQLAGATGVGALVLAALRGPGQPGGRDLLALCLAMATMMAVNDLALVVVLWLAQPQPLPRVVSELRPMVVPVWLLGGAINL